MAAAQGFAILVAEVLNNNGRLGDIAHTFLRRRLESPAALDAAASSDLLIKSFGGKVDDVKDSNPLSTSRTNILVGIVLNASAIVQENMMLLSELACKHNVESHVLAGHGVEGASNSIRHLMRKHEKCAKVSFMPEPSRILEGTENRVDRIARLRDYQRDRLRKEKPHLSNDSGVVMVVDLDLAKLPSAIQLMAEAQHVRDDDNGDVVCAAGVMHNPLGYYDIFA